MTTSSKGILATLALLWRTTALFSAAAAVTLALLFAFYLRAGGSTSDWHTALLLASPPRQVVPRTREQMQQRLNAQKSGSCIRQPPICRADEATLLDDEVVLGVCIERHARAYSLMALAGGPAGHVVNDVLGGQSVSVVYCDRTDCVRAYSVANGGEPLPLANGGWLPDIGMLLQLGDAKYALHSGANLSNPDGPSLPLPRLTPTRTTWKQWRRAHPDTDVYELFSS